MEWLIDLIDVIIKGLIYVISFTLGIMIGLAIVTTIGLIILNIFLPDVANQIRSILYI